jgi:hypothetical protein
VKKNPAENRGAQVVGVNEPAKGRQDEADLEKGISEPGSFLRYA